MDVFIYMINISKSWSNKNYLWQWPKQECRTFLSFQFLTFWQFFEDCLDLEHFTWIHPYGNKLFHCLQIRKKISRAWLNKIAQIVDILNWPFILRKLAFSCVEKNVLAVLRSKGIQYTNFWAIIKLWQFAMIHVRVILWSSGKEWRYTPTFWLRISRSFA